MDEGLGAEWLRTHHGQCLYLMDFTFRLMRENMDYPGHDQTRLNAIGHIKSAIDIWRRIKKPVHVRSAEFSKQYQ
jgi:hypothetical protein